MSWPRDALPKFSDDLGHFSLLIKKFSFLKSAGDISGNKTFVMLRTKGEDSVLLF